MNRIFIRALSLFTALFVTTAVRAAVTITVVPNSSTSTLTHTISGIAPGEKVTIERIADLNGNNLIDAGEPVVRSFAVQDGVRPIIGGVVNGNVPGDDDGATNSSIRVDLPYPGVDLILNTLPGKYIIRATGPSGVGTTVYNLTATSTPQKIIGVVRNSANNTAIPYAIIVVLVGDGIPLTSVRADSAGNYIVNQPAGGYALIPFADNFVGSFTTANLLPNVDTVQDLMATPAAITVSGQVTDNATHAGLSSIFVIAEGDSGLAGSLSDLSGNYSLKVTPGNWKVHPLEDSVAQLGYLIPKESEQTVTVNSSPVTSNFQLSRANALLYGRVTNAVGVPLGLLSMRAQGLDPASSGTIQLQAQGRTSPGGDYFLGVLGNSDWDFSPHDFIGDFVVLNYNASPNVGQAIQQNMTVQPATGHIMGTVKNSGGQPFGNLNVHASATINNFVYDIDANTDDSGFYSIPAINGTWNVSLDCNSLSGMNYACPLNQSVIVNNNSPTADFTLQSFNVTAHLNGTVINQSGQPMGNVQLAASTSGLIRNATSDPTTGSFSIGVNAGQWILQVAGTPPNGLAGPTINLTVQDGVDINNILMRLISNDATITGSLKNIYGEAIPGVHIHFMANVNNIAYQPADALTTAQGTFTAAVPKGSVSTYPDCADLNQLSYVCLDPISLNTTSGSARFDAVVPKYGPSIINPHFVNSTTFEIFINPINTHTTYDIQGSGAVPFTATSPIIKTVTINSGGVFVQFDPTTNRFFRVIAR